jgi:hypothetical protein
MSNVLLPMDTRRQLLQALRTRYQAASKAEKTRMLEDNAVRWSSSDHYIKLSFSL